MATIVNTNVMSNEVLRKISLMSSFFAALYTAMWSISSSWNIGDRLHVPVYNSCWILVSVTKLRLQQPVLLLKRPSLLSPKLRILVSVMKMNADMMLPRKMQESRSFSWMMRFSSAIYGSLSTSRFSRWTLNKSRPPKMC